MNYALHVLNVHLQESVYEDKAIFQELHDYYKRELMAEFVINKRSFDFFSKWIKVFRMRLSYITKI